MTEDSLITAGLGFGSPADRAAFLDQACAGNPERHDRVERRRHEQDRAGLAPDLPADDGDHTIDEYTTDREEDAQGKRGPGQLDLWLSRRVPKANP